MNIRKRYGNPKQMSRFVCLKCKQNNHVGSGIQRRFQREKFHVKDLYCIYCREVTKNIEIRYCDFYEEIHETINDFHEALYE